jgi:hypothetical protein
VIPTTRTKNATERRKRRRRRVRTVQLWIQTQIFSEVALQIVLKACVILFAFLPIYITVKEAIDSDEFDLDGLAVSRPIIGARPAHAI